MPDAISDPIPEAIGKYRIVKRLGIGGFGIVYLAADPDVDQLVAIKTLHATGDPDLVKRFLAEIRINAGLRHQNIVTIFAADTDKETGAPYVVMQFLEGSTLKQVIQAGRSLSLLDKVRIMTQVAAGLAHAHSKGVVHRDVKPENIMLLPDNTVKIMDFGIALAPDRNTTLTQTGGLIGTPPYFAPEQLDGYKANEQTDIFSYGDVYYELLTGHHPFEAYKDWNSLRVAIQTIEPSSVGELVPGCPEALETLVHRTLAKSPETRYRRFEEIQDDSAGIIADLQHEDVVALIQEARRHMDSGDLRRALDTARKANKLEPGNHEVRRLVRAIERKLDEDRIRQQVAQLQAEAQKLTSERRFAEAVKRLELAVHLDKANPALALKLEEAKALLDRYLAANRLVAEARGFQQKDLLDEALEQLKSALTLDPDCAEAARLIKRIEEELESQRQARRLAEQFNQGLAMVSAAIEEPDLERAGLLVDFLSAHFGTVPGAAEALTDLRRRLQALLKSREIERYKQRVQELLEAKLFDEALKLLWKALREFPGDPGLEALKRSAEDLFRDSQRAEAIDAVLREANAKRAAGDLFGALNTIREGQRGLGEDARFIELAHEIELELEQRRYSAGLEQLMQEAGELIAAGRYFEATVLIETAKEYDKEPEVRALREKARAGLAQEFEQHFVSERLSESENLEKRGELSQALDAVERGLARYPQNSRLEDAAGRLRELIARKHRRSAIEECRVPILIEIGKRAWERAAEAIRRARDEFPDEGAFDDLAAQVEAGLYELVRQNLDAEQTDQAEESLENTRTLYGQSARYTELKREIDSRRDEEGELRKAERLMASGHLVEAEQVLNGILDRRPSAKRALGMLDTVRRRLSEELRQAEIAKVRDSIRERLKRDDFALACLELASARKRYPSEAIWDELQAELNELQQRLERRAALEAAIEGVRRALARDDLQEAISKLRAGRASYPGEVIWSTLEEEIKARSALLKRQSEVAAAAEKIRRLLRREPSAETRLASSVAGVCRTVLGARLKSLQLAAAELEAARAKYSGEAVWRTLQTEIDERRGFLSAESETVGRLNRVLDRGDVAAAEQMLSEARERYPDEEFWSLFLIEISDFKERQARWADIGRIAQRVRDLLRGDDLPGASAELKIGRSKYPNEPIWRELEAEIDARKAASDREAEIDEVRRCVAGLEPGIRGVLEAQADVPPGAYPVARVWELLRSVNSRLDQARAKYPEELVWDSLQAEVAQRKSQLEREIVEAVRACSEFPVLDWNRTQLDKARARYPNEPFWPILEAEIAVCRAPLEQASIRECEAQVQESLKRNHFDKSEALLAAARKKHPGMPLWDLLQTEIDAGRAQWKRRQDLDAVEQTVREQLGREFAFSAPTELERAVNSAVLRWRAVNGAAQILAEAESIYPQEPRLAVVKDAVVRQQEESAQRFGELIRNYPKADVVRFAGPPIRDLRAREPSVPLWKDLVLRIYELEALLQREAVEEETRRQKLARDGDRDRLLAIRQQIETEAAKRKRRALDREARQIAARYGEDPEIAALVAEIHALIEVVQPPQTAPSKTFRWKWIAACAGAAAVVAVGLIIWLHKPATIRIEIRTDPTGASVKFGGRSCVSPCSLDVKPGSYQVDAELNDSQAGQQVVVDGTHRIFDLKLLPGVIPIEIRTDPAGASVKFGDRSCNSPCGIYMKPGRYQVEAQSDGYQLLRQTVNVDAAHRAFDLKLLPVAAMSVEIRSEPPGASVTFDGGPPCVTPCRSEAKPGQHQLEAKLRDYAPEQRTVNVDAAHRRIDLKLIRIDTPKGTLVVQTQVENVDVYVDGVPRGTTDQSGSLTLKLEAKTKAYDVRVERKDYEKLPSRLIMIPKDTQKLLTFTLVPLNARLVLNGAPQGLEVRLDGAPLGRADGSAACTFPKGIPPGNHTVDVPNGTLQAAQGSASRSLTQQFEPGQQIVLTWKADPAPPPPPDEIAWGKLHRNDSQALRVYLSTYPGSKHDPEAKSALAALDDQAWNNRTKDSVESLRLYLRDFPDGMHVTQANTDIDDLLWNQVDKTNAAEIQKFLDSYPKSAHAPGARQRLNQIKATQEALKQITDILDRLDLAFRKGDASQLRALWPKVPESYSKPIHTSYRIRRIAGPAITGDRAETPCILTTIQHQPAATSDINVTVVLKKSDGKWQVEEIKPAK